MGDPIWVLRGLGVLLALVILSFLTLSIVDGLPTASSETWLGGELSLLALGILLLVPWRYIVVWRFWWIPFVLLNLAFFGVVAFLAPAVLWAAYHSAIGASEILLGSGVILIYLAQLVAIWQLRRRARRSRGTPTNDSPKL